MLKSKGLLLTLFWNFSILSVFHYVVVFHTNNRVFSAASFSPYSGWFFFPAMMVYPVVGWLADTRYGRCKTVRCGLWIMWVTAILLSAVSVAKYRLSSHLALNVLDVLLFLALSVGLTLCQSSIIQLGIDQLTGASSGHITSYLNWYTWSFFAGELLICFTQMCVWSYGELVSLLVLPVLLTLSLFLDLFLGGSLVVEPVTHSPFRLFYGVLRYAAKNKYPRLRSAFTYWGDQHYSRIDLAKSKYGGPYTTEEVENVKVFFRILCLVCIMSAFVGTGYTYTSWFRPGIRFYNGSHHLPPADCSQNVAVHMLGSVLVVVFVPAYEWVLRPCCSGYVVRFTSRNKFTAGLVCMLLTLLTYLVLYLSTLPGHSSCGLLVYRKSHAGIHLYFLPIPKVLEAFAKIWLFGSSLEFVCAQSPYSMKSLLFGTWYAVSGVIVLVTFVAFLPFRYHFKNVDWSKTVMSCGLVLVVVYIVLFFLLLSCFVVINCSYKKRQRSEELPSQHCFAEQYYSQTEPSEASMGEATSGSGNWTRSAPHPLPSSPLLQN